MNPIDAARLLDLSPDATPEQAEARFQELRARLEDKIAKAPTPGLKAKYRESLDEITRAFETLTLAADGSALPVLKKEAAAGRREAGNPAASDAAQTAPRASNPPPAPAARRQAAGGREFIVVAVLAVVVLAAGGWWVMKTRAENAEKARIAAEAKAEADRKAEETRLAAEAKRKAEEEEKARLAAAAKAEQERVDKLTAATRARLAEFRITWDSLEQEARAAERAASELRSEERSLARDTKTAPGVELLELRARLAAQEDYSNWITQILLRHPAKVARAQAEEMLGARQVDEAARLTAEAAAALNQLEAEIAENKRERLAITGALRVEANFPAARYTLTDAYGRKRSGQVGEEVSGLPLGRTSLEISLDGFEARKVSTVVRRRGNEAARAEFKPAVFELTSTDPNIGYSIDAPKGAKGAGVLAVVPEGKARQVDGQLEIDGPARVSVTPGKWTVRAWSRLRDADETPACRADEAEFTLAEAQSASFEGHPRRWGRLSIVSEPAGADLVLGRIPLMKAQPGEFRLVGDQSYVYQLSMPGYFTQEIAHQGKMEQEEVVTVKLTPDDGTSYVGVGLQLVRNSTEGNLWTLRRLFLQEGLRSGSPLGSDAVNGLLNDGIAQVNGRVFVVWVLPGSPADQAGIRMGDEIVEISDRDSYEGKFGAAVVLAKLPFRPEDDLNVSAPPANATPPPSPKTMLGVARLAGAQKNATAAPAVATPPPVPEYMKLLRGPIGRPVRLTVRSASQQNALPIIHEITRAVISSK